MNHFVKYSIIFGSIGITLYSIDRFSSLSIQNTTIWWIIQFFCIILFLKGKNIYYNNENNKNVIWVKLFLIWNLICIIRGLFIAEGYWEWKFLIHTSWVLLLPVCIFILTNTYVVQKIIEYWFKVMLPAFFILIIFLRDEAIGHYLIPVSFLLLFWPILDTKWKMLTLAISVLVFSASLGARSNVIKFLIPILLIFAYYLKFFFTPKVIKGIRLIIMALPFCLLTLGITGTFNVFNMKDYIKSDIIIEREQAQGGKENLISDTRTFLYAEVISSALKYNYVWFGRTPARGYESPWFGPMIDKDLGTDKMERHSSEVSILNIFNWTGVLGVILYFSIFFKATYLAIYQSNSRIMLIIGLYLSFRWAYAWVEDFSYFNLSYFYLWLVIGIALSKGFRAMTDEELKNWVRGILDYRYRKVILKKQLVQVQKVIKNQ